MTSSPKKWTYPPQFFFVIFSKNVAFFKIIVKWKNIRNLISYKKCYIHFRLQTFPSLQKELDPEVRFFAVFLENTAFFEKTVK